MSSDDRYERRVGDPPLAPDLELAKSAVDLNGGPLDAGDEVLFTVRVPNNGQDAARNVVVSDVIPAGTSYVPDSLTIDDRPVTDVAGDDNGEVAATPARVVARLGTGANATAGDPIGVVPSQRGRR